MGALSASDLFVAKIINGYEGGHLRDIAHLSCEEKYAIACDLIDACTRDTSGIPHVICCLGGLIPQLRSDRRFRCVVRILDLSKQASSISQKELFHILDLSLMQSLLPLEMITLGNMLADGVAEHRGLLRETFMWGLIRVIPFMHAVNQKEYAFDIFRLQEDEGLRAQVLEALTALIFSLGLENRVDMTFFFLDNLKRNESEEVKTFTLDLMRKVTPVLPENDRLQIADTVVPLLYFAEESVAKRTIEFLAATVGFLDEGERYHYTQMIVGLLDKTNLRVCAAEALERAIHFLNDEQDRAELRHVLSSHEGHSSQPDQQQEEYQGEPAFVEKE